MSSETIGQTQHYPGFNVDVKILDKRLNEPEYRLKHATAGSAAIDLRACIDTETMRLFPNQTVLIPAGFAMQMSGTKLAQYGISVAAMLLPRSGLGHEHGIVLGNSAGLIDYDYTGQVMISVHNRSKGSFIIKAMDRICQMLYVPVFAPVQFNIVENLNETERGSFGFGSTGRL